MGLPGSCIRMMPAGWPVVGVGARGWGGGDGGGDVGMVVPVAVMWGNHESICRTSRGR